MSFCHPDLLEELTALSQTLGWINGSRDSEEDERTRKEGMEWKRMGGKGKIESKSRCRNMH